jgi:peptidoglycan/xylan/chitin deacetylase (PgdA/CDA1 family)
MKPVTYITTSWDDGHPLDLRVAELLTKYGLPGTFYVPRTADTGTMTAAQLRDLSGAFEIGAHTLHHLDLTRETDAQAEREISGSKSWVEDIIGSQCSLFCPPKGKYCRRHLDFVRRAGFLGVRSVELLSLDYPRLQAGLLVLPTTLQAHPHGLPAYARNVVRRAALSNLWLYLSHGRSTDWPKLARSLMRAALVQGGVFHLWGHSWELEKTGQWQVLEDVLRFLSQFIREATALSNGQLCRAVSSLRTSAGAPCAEIC